MQGRLELRAGAPLAFLSVNPGARSSYRIAMRPREGLEKLALYDGGMVQARIDVLREKQGFVVGAELVEVQFSLPHHAQAVRSVTLEKPLRCR